MDAPVLAGAQRREYEAITRRIAADVDGRVLDWGAGLGQVTHLLTKAGVDVEAFDYDARTDVVVPLAPHFPELSVRRSSDPVTLPYPDESFAAVLSCGVLEHVKDPTGSLLEIRRVLRPGGTLYVFKLPNERSYLEWIARHVGLDYHGELPDDQLYTPTTARRLVESCGYRVSELRYANMLPLTLTSRWLQPFTGAIWTVSSSLAKLALIRTLATNIELVASKEP